MSLKLKDLSLNIKTQGQAPQNRAKQGSEVFHISTGDYFVQSFRGYIFQFSTVISWISFTI